ncbi:MAG: LexA family protein [Gammaproteobacteria bacterium]
MYRTFIKTPAVVKGVVDHGAPSMSISPSDTLLFTERQGQYLAFIYAYTKVNSRAPAEADIQRYFGVSPPSVHQMVLALQRNQLIQRTPGKARSIEILVPPERLPVLR